MTGGDDRTASGLLEFDREMRWPRVLLFALGTATILVVGVAATTSSTAFGPYNPTWEGTTDLRSELESDPSVDADLVRSTTRYEEVTPEETVAFVVAPDEPYDEEASQRVGAFVEDGGSLVVLENFGEAGNALLADVNADSRVDGRLLRDEHSYDRGPAMPIAAGVTDHPLTTDVDQLTLNYATAVDPGSENATVLVTTGDVAYLGSEDGTLAAQDTLGAYPVATAEEVGNGRVVVIGDPSIVINAMLDRPDNAAFVRGLYADEDRVLLDVSHATDIPPLIAAVLSVRESAPLQGALGIAGIGTIVLLSNQRTRRFVARIRSELSGCPQRAEVDRVVKERGFSERERIELIRQTHPECDDEQIEHVAQTVARIRGDSDE